MLCVIVHALLDACTAAALLVAVGMDCTRDGGISSVSPSMSCLGWATAIRACRGVVLQALFLVGQVMSGFSDGMAAVAPKICFHWFVL